ncbi:unnamed protein product [Chrysodeixis includens]|uniref:Uncharacterized protein n=1 Tax=Chrysodeixis includens TaxID=689277 RepID=A0A9N8KTQ5_CHRIL|nr:unnamed protein product [Chrysodeixis includens]
MYYAKVFLLALLALSIMMGVNAEPEPKLRIREEVTQNVLERCLVTPAEALKGARGIFILASFLMGVQAEPKFKLTPPVTILPKPLRKLAADIQAACANPEKYPELYKSFCVNKN